MKRVPWANILIYIICAVVVCQLILGVVHHPKPLSHLASRGMVSPSNDELLKNTIFFGVPAVFCFIMRM